jgi:hypothetical protein
VELRGLLFRGPATGPSVAQHLARVWAKQSPSDLFSSPVYPLRLWVWPGARLCLTECRGMVHDRSISWDQVVLQLPKCSWPRELGNWDGTSCVHSCLPNPPRHVGVKPSPMLARHAHIHHCLIGTSSVHQQLQADRVEDIKTARGLQSTFAQCTLPGRRQSDSETGFGRKCAQAA